MLQKLQSYTASIKKMDFTLEKYSIFPFVAWTIVIGFAIFTYNLTTTLTAKMTEIDHTYLSDNLVNTN